MSEISNNNYLFKYKFNKNIIISESVNNNIENMTDDILICYKVIIQNKKM